MDDQRVGRIVRALRRRRGWRQVDVALAAGCSQNLISLVERGHLDRISVRVLRQVLGAVDASAAIELRWRGAALDRLLDEAHAALVGAVSDRLRRLGWLVEVEVTYSEFGERGSFDILAFHPGSGVLLVIEVKTDMPSAEATLRKLDEKTRLAAQVARTRFGWRAASVARVLVMTDSSTLRGRVRRHANVFGTALPARNVEVQQWLRTPTGALSGLWFFRDIEARVGIAALTSPERVRRPKSGRNNPPIAA